METNKLLGDPTRERTTNTLGADFSRPALPDSGDIEEFPLLLQNDEVRALIDAARQQGLARPDLHVASFVATCGRRGRLCLSGVTRDDHPDSRVRTHVRPTILIPRNNCQGVAVEHAIQGSPGIVRVERPTRR